MAKKFTYSRSFIICKQEENGEHDAETFTAVEFDSFDEARKVVDKAVYERKLELGIENKTLMKTPISTETRHEPGFTPSENQ